MKQELNILWTNADPVTGEKMVCMYAHNAVLGKWWDKVTVIIWGATAGLVAGNELFHGKIKQMIEDGVVLSACKACADELGVSSKLEELGIEVKYWGEALTDILKSDAKLITI